MARPTLKKGISGNKGTPTGDAILLWRNFIGIPPAANETHFDFGPSTAAATEKWQAANGLTADGQVGPKTWAKYDSMAGFAPPPSSGIDVSANAAARAIANANPLPSSANAAAKALASSTTLPPSVRAALAAKAAGTTIPTTKLEKVKAVEHGIMTEVENLYHRMPLWSKIGLGTFSALFTFVGLKKLFTR